MTHLPSARPKTHECKGGHGRLLGEQTGCKETWGLNKTGGLTEAMVFVECVGQGNKHMRAKKDDYGKEQTNPNEMVRHGPTFSLLNTC